MRFHSLDLIAFGPFTDTSIDLSRGQEGLHLIYGANESGKSSALRALRQFLFGIPANSSDNFVHPHTAMRVGATIVRSDGTEFRLVRRKGNKNTLRNLDDEQIVEEFVLEELLSGMGRKQFELLFGLDHDALVAGGAELLTAGSDLGQIIFSAGAGISAVQGVLGELEAAAKELFLPSGRNPRINSNLGRLTELRNKLKQTQLSHGEWSRHESELALALKEKESCERELAARQRELRRLERLHDAAPIVAKRSLKLREREAIGDVVALPEDFADRARAQLTEQQHAKSLHEQALARIAELEKKLVEICVPEDMLKHCESVEALHKELGSHQKAAQDRIKLETQLGDCEREAAVILKSLGREVDLDRCEHLRVTNQHRALLRDLMRSAEAVQSGGETATRQCKRLETELERIREQLAGLPPHRESASLQKEVRRLQRLGPLEEQLEGISAEIERLEVRIQNGKGMLSLTELTNVDMEGLAVPFVETIEKYSDRLSHSEAEIKDLLVRLDEAQAKLDRAQQEMVQLELEMDVPTESALKSSREKRDRGWRLIKRWWLDGDFDDTEVRAFSGHGGAQVELATAYEDSVLLSDETGDRLRREAERVGQKTSLLAQIADLQDQKSGLERTLESAREAQRIVNEEWCSTWSAIGVRALTPREMLKWREWYDKLTEFSAEAREKASHRSRLTAQVERARADLVAALQDVGEKAISTSLSLADLIEYSESVMQSLSETEQKRNVLKADMERVTADLQHQREVEEAAVSRLEQWTRSWRDAIAVLGIPENSSATEAQAVLDAVELLFVKLEQRGNLKQRIAGIVRDSDAYGQRVRDVALAVAPEMAVSDVGVAVEEMKDRLRNAQRLQSEYTTVKERLDEQRQLALRQDEILTATSDTLSVMCKEARCDSPDYLLPLAAKSQESRHLSAQIEEMDEQLAKLCGDVSLEEFVSSVQTTDTDALSAQIETLSGETEEFREKLEMLNQTIGSERAELRRMNGAADGAVLAEQMEAVIAVLRDDAEHYTRLRAAQSLLRIAVDRYRDKNQSPVLQNASEIFARLTGGSFSGLKADVNDKDEAVLLGVRSGGGEVGLPGMSEGTRDQLYLALRLASVEHLLKGKERIPFIVDDVLVNFDDARAVAALQAFAELSRSTQVIFFTHHQHVVDLAREALSQDDLFVQNLGQCAPLSVAASV